MEVEDVQAVARSPVEGRAYTAPCRSAGMGLIRSLWQLTTVIVAGPAALVGLRTLQAGDVTVGAMFVGLALAFAVLSEVAYVRVTGGTPRWLAWLEGGRRVGD